MIDFNQDGMSEELFSCRCHNIDDIIVFELYTDKNYSELSICTQFNNGRNIFQRIVGAIKYIFRFHSRYTNWSETLVRVEDIDRIVEILTKYKRLEKESRLSVGNK